MDDELTKHLAKDPDGLLTYEYIANNIANIEKDRERAYIGQLLAELWGEDYAEHADEISARDDNFRRIYKRLFPSSAL